VTRISLVSLACTVLLLLVVLELVRRRRLQERYSLLWLLTGGVLLVLAAWPSALSWIARRMGIAVPANALFVLAGAFVMVVLLHYSTVLSRLSEQNVRLAQRAALLEERLAQHEQVRDDRGSDATRVEAGAERQL
jgi:hypothetical protein